VSNKRNMTHARGKEEREESASGVHTPGILYGCEKKGVVKFAIRKCMKTKEAQEA